MYSSFSSKLEDCHKPNLVKPRTSVDNRNFAFNIGDVCFDCKNDFNKVRESCNKALLDVSLGFIYKEVLYTLKISKTTSICDSIEEFCASGADLPLNDKEVKEPRSVFSFSNFSVCSATSPGPDVPTRVFFQTIFCDPMAYRLARLDGFHSLVDAELDRLAAFLSVATEDENALNILGRWAA